MQTATTGEHSPRVNVTTVSSAEVWLVSGKSPEKDQPENHILTAPDAEAAVEAAAHETPGFVLISATSLQQLEAVAMGIRSHIEESGFTIQD